MDKEIAIYDKGKLIGNVAVSNGELDDGALLRILIVNFDGVKYNVVHIMDMTSAVVIPADIAQRIHDMLKGDVYLSNKRDSKAVVMEKEKLNTKMEERNDE